MKGKDTSFKDYQKKVERNGFVFVRQTGDHFIYKRGSDTLSINPKGKSISKPVAQRLDKQFNLK